MFPPLPLACLSEFDPLWKRPLDLFDLLRPLFDVKYTGSHCPPLGCWAQLGSPWSGFLASSRPLWLNQGPTTRGGVIMTAQHMLFLKCLRSCVCLVTASFSWKFWWGLQTGHPESLYLFHRFNSVCCINRSKPPPFKKRSPRKIILPNNLRLLHPGWYDLGDRINYPIFPGRGTVNKVLKNIIFLARLHTWAQFSWPNSEYIIIGVALVSPKKVWIILFREVTARMWLDMASIDFQTRSGEFASDDESIAEAEAGTEGPGVKSRAQPRNRV